MNVELRPCTLLKWSFCDGDCEKCRTFATTETVYNRYIDTAGNYHWTGVYSGEHKVIKENLQPTCNQFATNLQLKGEKDGKNG